MIERKLLSHRKLSQTRTQPDILVPACRRSSGELVGESGVSGQKDSPAATISDSRERGSGEGADLTLPCFTAACRCSLIPLRASSRRHHLSDPFLRLTLHPLPARTATPVSKILFMMTGLPAARSGMTGEWETVRCRCCERLVWQSFGVAGKLDGQ